MGVECCALQRARRTVLGCCTPCALQFHIAPYAHTPALRHNHQAELARVRAEAAAEVAAAAGRAATCSDTLSQGDGAAAALQEQKVAQLEQSVAQLTAALADRQREADARVSELERRHLQEREKLRREAAARIRETKVAMAQLAGAWCALACAGTLACTAAVCIPAPSPAASTLLLSAAAAAVCRPAPGEQHQAHAG